MSTAAMASTHNPKNGRSSDYSVKTAQTNPSHFSSISKTRSKPNQEAQKEESKEKASSNRVCLGSLVIKPLKAELSHMNRIYGRMDPYCQIEALGAEPQKTLACNNNATEPQWKDALEFDLYQDMKDIQVQIWDQDDGDMNDDLLMSGNFEITPDILTKKTTQQVVQLYRGKVPSGRVMLEFEVFPSNELGYGLDFHSPSRSEVYNFSVTESKLPKYIPASISNPAVSQNPSNPYNSQAISKNGLPVVHHQQNVYLNRQVRDATKPLALNSRPSPLQQSFGAPVSQSVSGSHLFQSYQQPLKGEPATASLPQPTLVTSEIRPLQTNQGTQQKMAKRVTFSDSTTRPVSTIQRPVVVASPAPVYSGMPLGQPVSARGRNNKNILPEGMFR